MFQFKRFKIEQDLCAMKVGTDGVLLGAWARGGDRMLDVGCGTGVIALMLAQRYPQGCVTALDIDEGAVCQTEQNVAQSPFADRVEVIQGAVQTFENNDCYDAIVSNPPFFVDSLNAPDPQRNIARHAETLTYSQLMLAAWRLLKDNGELSVVVPFDYRKRMEDEAIFVGFFPSCVCAVRTAAHKAPKRFLLAFRKHPCNCEKAEITLGDETYTNLTRDFYL
jgi:tRNA1Val (adenine37-N6)-methyltransferase